MTKREMQSFGGATTSKGGKPPCLIEDGRKASVHAMGPIACGENLNCTKRGISPYFLGGGGFGGFGGGGLPFAPPGRHSENPGKAISGGKRERKGYHQ